MGSTDSACRRKVEDLLRSQIIRLIQLESERGSTLADKPCDIATLMAVARANIESGIRESAKRHPDDAYDKQKYTEMLSELPSAHIALDVGFRRWTEEAVCFGAPMDVEMIAA